MVAPDLLAKIKPMCTQAILYFSSQLRMLRALKRAGLDFSKVCTASWSGRMEDPNYRIMLWYVDLRWANVRTKSIVV